MAAFVWRRLTNLVRQAGGGQLQLSQDHLGWRLQIQTNNLSQGIRKLGDGGEFHERQPDERRHQPDERFGVPAAGLSMIYREKRSVSYWDNAAKFYNFLTAFFKSNEKMRRFVLLVVRVMS